MNETISAALHEHADGDIHIERLLDAVHTGVRRRRRRRFALATGGVVAVVALVAAGGVVVDGTRETPAVPADSATVGGPIPRPPLVEGVPVAAFTPTVLGSDPTLFHLDVTGLSGWRALTWSSRPGYEDLRGEATEAGGNLMIEATQVRDHLSGQAGEISAASVNGVPAEAVRMVMGGSALRWEAVPGIWVQVVVTAGPDTALRMAERVRLDRTLRCAVPFRMTGLGSDVRMVKCETWFAGVHTSGGAWLSKTPTGVDYQEYYVGVGRSTPSAPTSTTIGGRAVALVPTTQNMSEHIEYPYEGGVGFFFAFYPPNVTDPFLRSLVPAFEPVAGTDPTSWPQSPL